MKSNKRSSEVVSLRFQALSLGLVCGLLGLSSVYALPHVAQSPRDTADRLSRIDTNRAADMQIIKGTQNKAVREAIQKQIVEDFRSLQSLNNKMMADAWKNPELDYKYISDMIGQIAKKAERLKSNLALPDPDKPKDPQVPQKEIGTAQDFKAELMLLDTTVMRFVTNPIFQKTGVVELKLANQASEDLEKIIDMSKGLRKAGTKLKKGQKD